MIIFRQREPLEQKLQQLQREGRRIGFVPTMGALHQGHMRLIETSLRHTDVTVCSIFVNPAQFNDPKDFEKYPLTPENDIRQLIAAGTNILFLPEVREIYPEAKPYSPDYPLGQLGQVLEGKYRPGHFHGVCMVMDRLLHMVRPHDLFMGQKDYQQCMVVKKLINLLQLPVNLNIVPTCRENSGLAMSSRNMLLSDLDKANATGLYQALLHIKENSWKAPLSALCEQAKAKISAAGFDKTDYVEVCDADTLAPLGDDADPELPKVALAAAFIGGVRLIDNLLL